MGHRTSSAFFPKVGSLAAPFFVENMLSLNNMNYSEIVGNSLLKNEDVATAKVHIQLDSLEVFSRLELKTLRKRWFISD